MDQYAECPSIEAGNNMLVNVMSWSGVHYIGLPFPSGVEINCLLWQMVVEEEVEVSMLVVAMIIVVLTRLS